MVDIREIRDLKDLRDAINVDEVKDQAIYVWKAMDEETTTSKKLLFFELLSAGLVGVMVGTVIGSKRTVRIGKKNARRAAKSKKREEE